MCVNINLKPKEDLGDLKELKIRNIKRERDMIQELESQKKEMFLNLNYNSIKSKKLKEFLQEI